MGKGLERGVILASGLLLAGCGGEEAYAPQAGTPPETMFQEGCAHCHGDQGQGKFGFLLDLQDTELTQAEIEALIAGGKGIMPGYPQLSTEQRRRLAAYSRGR